MSVSNNKILNIYKSRSNILEILSDNLGYDTKEYDGFSINEIDAMYSNSQLDMLVKHNDSNRKIYIKYYLTAKQIRPQNLDDIIEDLFTIESILTKEDTLIIITEDEPNDTIITKLKYLYDHDGIFVVIHNIRRLQYNILNHKLVPECTILQDKDIDTFCIVDYKKINIDFFIFSSYKTRYNDYTIFKHQICNKIIFYNTIPSTIINTLNYEVCSYKFINTTIMLENGENYMIKLKTETENYYIVNNKINKYVLSYLLYKQHNILLDLSIHKFKFEIIDHNVKLTTISDEEDIVFFNERYIIQYPLKNENKKLVKSE